MVYWYVWLVSFWLFSEYKMPSIQKGIVFLNLLYEFESCELLEHVCVGRGWLQKGIDGDETLFLPDNGV